jgi:hypothetical protein
MWFFSPNIKFFNVFETKVGTWMPHVIWFECLKILTKKNVQFAYLGGKVGGSV